MTKRVPANRALVALITLSVSHPAAASDCNAFFEELTPKAVQTDFFELLPALKYTSPQVWFLIEQESVVSKKEIHKDGAGVTPGVLRLDFATYSHGGIEIAYQSAKDRGLIPLDVQLKKLTMELEDEADESRPPKLTWKVAPYAPSFLSQGEISPGDLIVTVSAGGLGAAFTPYIAVHPIKLSERDPAMGPWKQDHGNVRWAVSVYHLQSAEEHAHRLKITNGKSFFRRADQILTARQQTFLRDLDRLIK